MGFGCSRGYAPVTVSLLAVVVLGRVLGLWRKKLDETFSMACFPIEAR